MGKPAAAMQKTGPDRSGAPMRPGLVPPKALARLFDYFIVPGVILALLYDPNYLHGYIDVLESGQYLSTSNGVFQGRVPYKDFFILFGPFQTYMITFVMAIFGKSLSVLRTFFYTNYIISFIIIYILGRQVCKKRFFAYLIPFICLVEVTHPFWAPRWDFGRMGLGLLALLMIILFLKRKDKRLLAGAGIVSSFTIFYTLDVGVDVAEEHQGKTILSAQEVEDVVAYLGTLNGE